MDLENQTSSQVSEASVPAPAEAPVQAPVDAPSDAVSEAQPTWQPDFRFKVLDKEHTIDPLFHSIVKDEDTLKKVRRLHEQALGVPHLEASRDEFKTKYNSLVPRVEEYDRVAKRLDRLSHFLSKGDFGTFFEELKIPRESVYAWINQDLKTRELPPEVQARMDEARRLERERLDSTDELSFYKSKFEEIQRQQEMQSIDNSINTLAGDVAGEFNTRMQSQDAFRNAVINKGAAVQQSTGQRLPLEQVVNLVKEDLRRVMGITGNGPQAPAPQAPEAQAAKPVIPVIKAGGASPVKAPIRSIADIKKIADAM